MARVYPKRMLAFFVTAMMVVSSILPTAAYAAESNVRVQGSSANAGPAKVVSDPVIDEVAAPVVGSRLDEKATVRTAEGESWQIPVLWIDQDLQVATQAEEGKRYLPVLTFFVPAEYSVKGIDDAGGYNVKLSDGLTKLFGGDEIVSIYDASADVTYILPAALRAFFERSSAASRDVAEEPAAPYAEEPTAPYAEEPTNTSQDHESAPNDDEPKSLVDIYCAKTARDVFSDEELEWLIDFIINKLQPEAVNLLIQSFPSFAEAARNNEIGRKIGLYIYYKKGDKDGISSHETASSALAYVAHTYSKKDGVLHYGYLIGVDTDDLALLDDDDNPVRDANGRLVLARSGENFITFCNTITHEMFHAFMDDYNRPGMDGIVRQSDAVTEPPISYKKREAMFNTRYPRWFIEGTASAVENVYTFRYNLFDALRAATNTARRNSATAIYTNYLTAKDSDGASILFPLMYSYGVDANGKPVETTPSQYVTGYLAVLYLGELAARNSPLGSSIKITDDNVTISSQKIRLGLDSILNRMHKGETLDSVIKSISPKVNGKTLYSNTNDFELQFIQGTKEHADDYDGASIEFVRMFYFAMDAIESQPGRKYKPNGSILFDFEQDFAVPVDGAKYVSSDFYKIVKNNDYEDSTVPDSTALRGGGRSVSGGEPAGAESSASDSDATTLSAVGMTNGENDEAGKGEAGNGEAGKGDAGNVSACNGEAGSDEAGSGENDDQTPEATSEPQLDSSLTDNGDAPDVTATGPNNVSEPAETTGDAVEPPADAADAADAAASEPVASTTPEPTPQTNQLPEAA